MNAPPFPRWIADLSGAEQEALIRNLTEREAVALAGDWPSWAHDGQCPPGDRWRTWVIMAGRGFGKTRAGAEWVAEAVRAAVARGETARIALVGATVDEARRVMVEGPSGLLTVARDVVAGWFPTRRLLRFAGGSEATLYSGASPESLRGPEHSHAWCDELAKWQHPLASWSMLQLGLRVGDTPRAVVTTTPRSGPLLGRILAEPDTVVSRGRTRANPHLPAAFVSAVEALYGGTRLGAQEIEGDYDASVAGQLFPPALIAACRVASPLPPEREGSTREASGGGPVPFVNDRPSPSPLRGSSPPALAGGDSFLKQTWPGTAERAPLPWFERVAIGVDPPADGGTCGIVACARDRAGHGHVLADHSVSGASPEGWARAVVAAAARYPDPLIVAEINQGGAMVKSVLRSAGLTARVRTVRAKAGKAERAVPIALLFEQGRVSLHGEMFSLEEELAGLVAGGEYQGPGDSPDRADAMVWALGEVMAERVVRVRGF